jgi:hypothetical protein
MIFEKFVGEVSEHWKNYFNKVSSLQKKGELTHLGDEILLYPNIILFTNCAGYYTCELLGVSEAYVGLTIKKSQSASIYRYLNQFDDGEPDPLFELGRGGRFAFLTLSQSIDLDVVSKRFPSVQFYKAALIRDNGRGSVFSFREEFDSCIVDCCVIVNVSGPLSRCKNILHLMICRNSIASAGIAGCYQDYMNDPLIKGVHNVAGQDKKRQVVAGQLQNLYLFKGLHETTLGEFFRLHPDIVYRAFNTDSFHYEPHLRWVEHDGTCEDEAINPDLLVRRADGFYDIFDLKNGLIDTRNVTKGGRKRRRFIDYVEEGVAQLVNYREYFTYPKNALLAKEKYGVEVSSPNLVLVVGNWDNSSVDEVQQACRRYPDIRIIDYDSLCHMFLGTDLQGRLGGG